MKSLKSLPFVVILVFYCGCEVDLNRNIPASLPAIHTQNNPSDWRIAVLDIGGWDMMKQGYKSVPHHLTLNSIVSVSVTIIADGGTTRYNLMGGDGASDKLQGAAHATEDSITVARPHTSQFNSLPFVDTKVNRGFITIIYIPSLAVKTSAG